MVQLGENRSGPKICCCHCHIANSWQLVGFVKFRFNFLFFRTERIVRCQSVQDQVKLVRGIIGDETLRFRCLPKQLNLLSACSGTGLFELCAHALIKEINPEACVLSIRIFHRYWQYRDLMTFRSSVDQMISLD